MAYSHVIWDFNGTILDDTDAAIKSENVLLSRRNMPLIKNKEQYHSTFCFPIIEYYKKLGHDFEKESYNDLAVEWIEQYLSYSERSKLHDGVMDMLARIKTNSISQIILSATEKEMLTNHVDKLGIKNYFNEILGLNNIHAYSKVDIAKEWVERVKPRKAVLFGDTIHDFEVAKEIGVECILVANGHQNKETLSSCGVPVFNNMKQLLESGIVG